MKILKFASKIYWPLVHIIIYVSSDGILAERTLVLSLLCHKADFHRRYAMGPYSIFTQLCVFVYFSHLFCGL